MARRAPQPSAGLVNPSTLDWVHFGKSITLWHGTLKRHADSMARDGVDPKYSRLDLDFGRGFYTTTWQWQAEDWAIAKYCRDYPRGNPIDPPVILRFEVPLDELAKLENLAFVRGSSENELYWSFVHYCRGSTVAMPRLHRPYRDLATGWYDVVMGPVAAAWVAGRRRALPGYDQYSFHTPSAASVLNTLILNGNPSVFHFTELQRPY